MLMCGLGHWKEMMDTYIPGMDTPWYGNSYITESWLMVETFIIITEQVEQANKVISIQSMILREFSTLNKSTTSYVYSQLGTVFLSLRQLNSTWLLVCEWGKNKVKVVEVGMSKVMVRPVKRRRRCWRGWVAGWAQVVPRHSRCHCRTRSGSTGCHLQTETGDLMYLNWIWMKTDVPAPACPLSTEYRQGHQHRWYTDIETNKQANKQNSKIKTNNTHTKIKNQVKQPKKTSHIVPASHLVGQCTYRLREVLNY